MRGYLRLGFRDTCTQTPNTLNSLEPSEPTEVATYPCWKVYVSPSSLYLKIGKGSSVAGDLQYNADTLQNLLLLPSLATRPITRTKSHIGHILGLPMEEGVIHQRSRI